MTVSPSGHLKHHSFGLKSSIYKENSSKKSIITYKSFCIARKPVCLYSAYTTCLCLCPTRVCGTWANVRVFLNMLSLPTITLCAQLWMECLPNRRACPITNVCTRLPVKHAHVGYVCHVHVFTMAGPLFHALCCT